MHDGNYAQLVLLAHPDHLGLVAAEPDAAPVRPVGGHARGGQVVVGGHVVEEVVVRAHLVGLLVADEVLVAGREAVVAARDAEAAEHLLHGVLETDALLLAHAGRQVPALHVAGHSRAHGDALETGVDAGEQVLADGDVPAVLLFCVALDAVVLADQRLQIESEGVVVLRSRGVCAHRGVVVAQSAHHHVQQPLLVVLAQRAGLGLHFLREVLVGEVTIQIFLSSFFKKHKFFRHY